MSIQREKDIRKSLSKRDNDNIDKFLRHYPAYSFNDVVQRDDVHLKFETWQVGIEIVRSDYFYKGLSNDPFIRLTLEDLMNELVENSNLKRHVLEFANANLKENSLGDKRITMRAIENTNIESLYNHDTEIRENFCISFKGGVKSLKSELNKKSKEMKNKSHKEQSR